MVRPPLIGYFFLSVVCWRGAESEPVSCGQHMAPSCEECPQGNGASWCNGKCHWENGSCKPVFKEYLDYEDSGFYEEFPDISDYETGIHATPPKNISLHVNVYLDPYWVEYHLSKEYAMVEAKNTMAQASKLLQHHSLNTKFQLNYQSIYLSKQHIEAKDLNDKVLDELQPPFRVGNEFHVVHVYLTQYGPGVSGRRLKIRGRAKKNSICLNDKKAPRLITYWRRNSIRTGLTVAHEIGHVLGFGHDHKPAFAPSGDIVRGKCTNDQIKSGDGVLIMNYGEPRIKWSSCSNDDFARYFETVVTKNDKFCLETAPADILTDWTDCAWNDWSTWSTCSATCGEGFQRAIRSMAQEATGGGDSCEGDKEITQKCIMSACPPECTPRPEIQPRNITRASMNYPRLILTWSDCEKNYVDLENKGDCIHTGIVTGDQWSDVLVTGCDDEKIHVQIQSELIGDWLFSTVDGLAFSRKKYCLIYLC